MATAVGLNELCKVRIVSTRAQADQQLAIELTKANTVDQVHVVRVDEDKRLRAGAKFKESLQSWPLEQGDKIVFRDLKDQKKITKDQFWLVYAPTATPLGEEPYQGPLLELSLQMAPYEADESTTAVELIPKEEEPPVVIVPTPVEPPAVVIEPVIEPEIIPEPISETVKEDSGFTISTEDAITILFCVLAAALACVLTFFVCEGKRRNEKVAILPEEASDKRHSEPHKGSYLENAKLMDHMDSERSQREPRHEGNFGGSSLSASMQLNGAGQALYGMPTFDPEKNEAHDSEMIRMQESRSKVFTRESI